MTGGKREVTEHSSDPGGRGSVIPPDIDPVDPAFVRSNAAFGPVFMIVVHAILVYVGDFFKPGFLFGLIVLPPFTAFSWGIHLWARGKKLTGHRGADARKVVDTTAANLALQVIAAPVGSMVFFLGSVHLLLWGGVIGPIGYVVVVLTYLAIFVGSVFVFPEWHLRLEADSQSAKPRTVLGKVLSPQLPVPRPAAVAGPLVALTLLLRGLMSNNWEGAIAGSLSLALAFYAMIPSATSLVHFRRLWQIKKELYATTKHN
jgi:hypothetical protein